MNLAISEWAGPFEVLQRFDAVSGQVQAMDNTGLFERMLKKEGVVRLVLN
jgi:hypothetical protein